MRQNRGFTLIEMVIVVAIIGILVAVAYPGYLNYIKKGRRADAQGYLTQVAQRQQQYLLDARAYALGGSALTDLTLPVPGTVSQFYDVTVTPDAPTIPPSFVATAVPKGQQADDGTLTIDQSGKKERKVGAVDKGW